MKKLIALLSGVMLTTIISVASANMGGTTMEDTKITTEVKSMLIKEKGTSGTTVHVKTDNGVVHLTGHVKTPEEKAKAVEVAKSVNGVSSVQDDIQVQP